MNKIIQKLLEVTYPTMNIQSLLEIVGATPNPTLATEMLCGLYVEPIFQNKSVKSTNGEGILTFLDYDKWNDRVNYTYRKEETKSAYFPKTIKQEDVTLENFDSLKCQYKEGVTHTIYVKTGVMETRKSYISYNSWVNLQPVEAENQL